VRASMQAIGKTWSKPIRSIKLPSSWRRVPRKDDDRIRSATARDEQTNEKQVPSPQTQFKMRNHKRGTMQAIRKRCRRIPWDIGRACSKPIRSLKVPLSWRMGTRKEDDRIRSASERDEQTNEKQVPSPKTEFKMSNPKRGTMQAIRKPCRTFTSVIGRTCSKPIRSLKVPLSWRRGPRKEVDRMRSATARAEQTNEKLVPSLKTEFKMCNPKREQCRPFENPAGQLHQILEGLAASQ
jgi:hypothetical protein